MVIGSRIQERDKKNAEYYVGDYYHDTGHFCTDISKIQVGFYQVTEANTSSFLRFNRILLWCFTFL